MTTLYIILGIVALVLIIWAIIKWDLWEFVVGILCAIADSSGSSNDSGSGGSSGGDSGFGGGESGGGGSSGDW